MKKILFIHLPKTAGTFLGRCFINIKGGKIFNCGHISIADYSIKNGINDFNDYFIFGFVRNPWDWYVSRYFWFCKTDSIEQGLSKGSDAGLTVDDFKKQTFEDHIRYGFNASLVNPGFWLSDRYREMFCVDDDMKLNYVGKFESIYDDIENVLQINNLTFSRSWLKYWNQIKIKKESGDTDSSYKNKATKHDHYSTYYTEELKDIIREKDKDIIEKYGYEFEGVKE